MGAPIGNRNAAGKHHRTGKNKGAARKRRESREKRRISSLHAGLIKKYGISGHKKMFPSLYK